MLLDQALQPAQISLFSSTSSHPLLLATAIKSSTTATVDSFVSLLDDRTGEQETLLAFNGCARDLAQRSGAVLGKHDVADLNVTRHSLASRVLRLQDPDCRTTSVRWGTLSALAEDHRTHGLGITLEFVHVQVKNLEQSFFFDVAVLDDRGKVFVFRASTFQSEPKLYPGSVGTPTLVHLPLSFPAPSPTLVTSWCTVTLPLATLLASLPSLEVGGPSTLPRPPPPPPPPALAPGRFSSVIGIELHANCSVRRVWYSNDGRDVIDRDEQTTSRPRYAADLGMYAAAV